jgi:hypothetical protein
MEAALDLGCVNYAQAIQVIRKVDAGGAPVPCALTFVQFDQSNKRERVVENGKLKTIRNVIPAGANHSLKAHGQFSMKKADGKGEHPYIINWKLLLRVNGEFVYS